LGWEAKINFEDLAHEMAIADYRRAQRDK
jgi:hypothetical protein